MTPEERIEDALRRGMVRTPSAAESSMLPQGESSMPPVPRVESSRERCLIESSRGAQLSGLESSGPVPVPRRPKADPGSTYFGRMQAGLEDGATAGYLVGSEPSVRGPFAPSPIAWDTENVEPAFGEDISAVSDMTVVPQVGPTLAVEGETAPGLRWEDIDEIRRLWSTGDFTLTALAQSYGLTVAQLGRIITIQEYLRDGTEGMK